MSDETGRVWLGVDIGAEQCPLLAWIERHYARFGLQAFLRGAGCAQCHASGLEEHLHIYREFNEYRDDPHVPSWIVCSEGCAIALIQERGYTVIGKPEGVRT